MTPPRRAVKINEKEPDIKGFQGVFLFFFNIRAPNEIPATL
jgi:hypothetical protein